MSRRSSLLLIIPGERPGRQLAAAATIALTVSALAMAPAVAQSTETETPSSDGASGFDLDLGDVVQTDEDGTVTWNVETDSGLAETDDEAPTADPGTGITGTGTSDDVNGGAGTESGTDDSGRDRSPLDNNNAAGTGNTTAMILAIAGAAMVAVVGTMLFLRARKERQGEAALVEEVIDPAEPLAGGFDAVAAETPYDGAVDGGAYEAGGAAYAQFTNEPDHNVATAAAAAAAATGVSADDDSAPESRFDQLRSQVVGLADKGLADSGHDRLVAKKLEAAGSKMRPGEWLVLGVAGSTGAFFGVSFLLGWLLGAAAGILVAFGFWMWLDYMAGKRQKAFAEDLPETLGLIAGSLRGGLSMMQAIQTVADEADDPTAGEFQRLVTETRLGRDLAVSFRDLSQRMASQDFEWVVTAIEIHREVGGDLASILDRVSNTIRQRNRVRGQVKALSAEGRVSGLILFLLPLVMVGAISVMNRAYLNEMLNETAGQIMLIIAGVLLLVGGVWLKRLSRFIY